MHRNEEKSWRKKQRTQFECQACGYISPKYLGRCPNCGAWNEMMEVKIQEEPRPS